MDRIYTFMGNIYLSKAPHTCTKLGYRCQRETIVMQEEALFGDDRFQRSVNFLLEEKRVCVYFKVVHLVVARAIPGTNTRGLNITAI